MLALARWLGTPTGLALSSYAVLTIVFTWPVVLHLGRYVAGKPGDLRVALWDLWWLETAIQKNLSPFHTPYLFHPEGVSLAYHSVSWAFAAVALPLRALFGDVAGYNLAFFAQSFLCATSMYFLARYLVKLPSAAWLAGCIFAFEPFRMTRAMHHPNLAATGLIPLVILWSLRAWRERHPRFAVLGALALALVLLSGAHLFVMTALALGLVFVVEALRGCAFREATFWRVNAVFLVACLVFVAPIVWQYVDSSKELHEAVRSVSRGGSTDLAAFVVPSPDHPLFGNVFRSSRSLRGESGSVAYLGYVTLGLAVVGLVVRANRREAWTVWLLFVAFALLSLGPELEMAGRRTNVLLPHAWLDRFQAFRIIRAPERFNLVARVFLPLVAAFGFAALAGLLGRRARLAWVVVPLLLFDYLCVPHPAMSLRQPKFVRDLANGGGTGAILELPLTRGAAKTAMLSQTLHERPLVGGMVARTPRAAFRYIRRSPLLRSIEGKRPKRLDCREVPLRRELERLASGGIEYVVHRYRAATGRQRAAYGDFLVGSPHYEDATLRVYRIDALLERKLPCDSR